MQWIKHKKEERMAVAAKVIGAVRLGLVDIKVVIEEMDNEEMERVPEIHKQIYEALIYNFTCLLVIPRLLWRKQEHEQLAR